RIALNVGGRVFVVRTHLLDRFPNSLLGSLQIGQFYDKNKQEFFFDRDPDVFRYILNYLRSGRLHVSDEECFNSLLDELEFFHIPTEDILQDTCCQEYYGKNCEEVLCKHCEKNTEGKSLTESISSKAFYVKRNREKIWSFLTEPETSFSALIYFYIISLVTMLNALLVVAETNNCEVNRKCGEIHEDVFFTIDAFCVAVFTADYGARLATAKQRLHFARAGMNIIDVLALLPFYLTLILNYAFNIHQDYSFLTILRLFRVFRIIRLTKRSERLRAIASIATSTGLTDYVMVTLGVLMLLVFFSTIIYYVEQMSSDTQFESIPDAMWYAAVTITSLGYGDMVPSTMLGKLCGVATILTGFLGSSLLIPIV
ncbi:predicted protein, partial [Nematostella vectensis]